MHPQSLIHAQRTDFGFAARQYKDLVYQNADGKVDVPAPMLTSPGSVNLDQDLIFLVV